MNVNLVSDESNGYQYTSYFGEDIVIKPNSKCYLNYASLSRLGDQVLETDQILTLSSTELLPRKVVGADSSIIDNTLSLTKTIPAGTYSNLELQNKIGELIEEIVNSDAGKALHYYFSAPNEIDFPTGSGNLTVQLALDPAETLTDEEFIADSTDAFNSQTYGGGVGYRKVDNQIATDTQSYDNYANANQDFWFYTYASTGSREDSLIHFKYDQSHDASLLAGLYGNKYATLTNPSTAPNPMTTGAIRPALLTVAQPVDEVDPALGLQNSFSLSQLGGADILSQGTTGDFYEGYKVEVSTTGSTVDAVCYVSVVESVGQAGVVNLGYVSGTISGLATTTQFDLTQSATSGAGSGFQIQATSNGSGEISLTEVEAGKVSYPGNGYAQGDTITLVETTTPGVSSVVIVILDVGKYGSVSGFKWVSGTPDYPISIFDLQAGALAMGEGFVGNETLTISQDSNAGGTVDATAKLSTESTSACFSVPACFLACQIRGNNSQPLSLGADIVEVYFGQDSAGNFIGQSSSTNTDWASQDKKIERMVKIASFPEPTTSGTQHLGIRTYYSTSSKADYQGNTKKLFFRIVDVKSEPNGDITGEEILFDSITTGHYFPHSFFTGITPTDQDTVDIQTPFRVFLSVQGDGEGFETVDYVGYDRDGNKAGANDQYQASICERVTVEFSQQMNRILSLTAPVPLFPSSDTQDPLTYFQTDLNLFWANQSYYVVIEELPLTNYKNRREITAAGTGRVKKGMIKNILANIPLPFEALASQVNPARAGALVSGLYEPNKKIIVALQNQRIVTNRLSVKVFNMNDDTLADDIQQSIINFTIIGPDEM